VCFMVFKNVIFLVSQEIVIFKNEIPIPKICDF
jgi:hypothetical protein